MARGPGVSGGGYPPSGKRGPAPWESRLQFPTVNIGWGSDGETGTKMNAIVNGARSRSTLLTGAAGLLLLMTAVVMMVIAAPQIHHVRPGWGTPDHWIPVTPGSGSELIRTGSAPVP